MLLQSLYCSFQTHCAECSKSIPYLFSFLLLSFGGLISPMRRRSLYFLDKDWERERRTVQVTSVRGLSWMTSEFFFFDFLTPSPTPLSHTKISWFCSFCLLFGNPPPPTHYGRLIWKPPKAIKNSDNVRAQICFIFSFLTFEFQEIKISMTLRCVANVWWISIFPVHLLHDIIQCVLLALNNKVCRSAEFNRWHDLSVSTAPSQVWGS